MAMSATQMAQNIASNMNSLGINEPSSAQLTILIAMCEGIIQEIRDGGVVTTAVTRGSSSGSYKGDIE